MVHKTLELHLKTNCGNHNCNKPRNGETLRSEFHGPYHYVTWDCEKCGQSSWWKTTTMNSGLHHKDL